MRTIGEKPFTLQPEVASALRHHEPVVALETAVVTHGLPHPINIDLALEMEEIIRHAGAMPATIGMIAGKLYGGLTREQLVHLSEVTNARKISQRDFGLAMATHNRHWLP